MKRSIGSFAALALLPAMAGPLPAAQAATLNLALCSGGSMSIPAEAPGPANGNSPCCAKGCHNGSSRKRLDRAQ
jgi:hypothetical protein